MRLVRFKCKECGEIIIEESNSTWSMNYGPSVRTTVSDRLKHLLKHTFDYIEDAEL